MARNRSNHANEPGHWEERSYFDAMRPFLDEIGRCDSSCSPNYLTGHIGVYHSGKCRDFNFVALKGSRRSHFSIEIKTDEDPTVLRELEVRGWLVEPYGSVKGYRVHLPARLSKTDVDYLRALMRQAHREWPQRSGR